MITHNFHRDTGQFHISTPHEGIALEDFEAILEQYKPFFTKFKEGSAPAPQCSFPVTEECSS